MRVSQLNKYSW